MDASNTPALIVVRGLVGAAITRRLICSTSHQIDGRAGEPQQRLRTSVQTCQVGSTQENSTSVGTKVPALSATSHTFESCQKTAVFTEAFIVMWSRCSSRDRTRVWRASIANTDNSYRCENTAHGRCEDALQILAVCLSASSAATLPCTQKKETPDTDFLLLIVMVALWAAELSVCGNIRMRRHTGRFIGFGLHLPFAARACLRQLGKWRRRATTALNLIHPSPEKQRCSFAAGRMCPKGSPDTHGHNWRTTASSRRAKESKEPCEVTPPTPDPSPPLADARGGRGNEAAAILKRSLIPLPLQHPRMMIAALGAAAAARAGLFAPKFFARGFAVFQKILDRGPRRAVQVHVARA